MIKVQLYALIQQNKSRFPKYVINEMAKQNGHTFVKTPPCHCEFNASADALYSGLSMCERGFVKTASTTSQKKTQLCRSIGTKV